jgi:hypothetical protein
MTCDHCNGLGTVEARAGDPTYGRIECSGCDGSGRVCKCGDPIPLSAPAGTELCAQCKAEADEMDNVDALIDQEKLDRPWRDP